MTDYSKMTAEEAAISITKFIMTGEPMRKDQAYLEAYYKSRLLPAIQAQRDAAVREYVKATICDDADEDYLCDACDCWKRTRRACS